MCLWSDIRSQSIRWNIINNHCAVTGARPLSMIVWLLLNNRSLFEMFVYVHVRKYACLTYWEVSPKPAMTDFWSMWQQVVNTTFTYWHGELICSFSTYIAALAFIWSSVSKCLLYVGHVFGIFSVGSSLRLSPLPRHNFILLFEGLHLVVSLWK